MHDLKLDIIDQHIFFLRVNLILEKRLSENINWDIVVSYWLEEAENDMKVTDDLFEKEDYSYSLFFGHLALEKLLKALFVKNNKIHAPLIHNLERLAKSTGLNISEE